MNINFLKRLLLFLVLLVAQVLVLNHIHLFGYATPMLYIYFVISFQRGAFALGSDGMEPSCWALALMWPITHQDWLLRR